MSEIYPEQVQADGTTPGRWRKKPVVVEAKRVQTHNLAEMAEWCGGLAYTDETQWDYDAGAVIMPDGRRAHVGHRNWGVIVPTLEGDMLARCGWWIIKGVQGEHYPCKPDIFEATYEPASAASETTPEQAAYETFAAVRYPDPGDRTAWTHPAVANSRRAWRAAAQAAIDAHAAAARTPGVPGMVAYAAYCAASDGKSLISGAPLPAWEEQAPAIRGAWRAVADGVLMHASLPPLPEQWAEPVAVVASRDSVAPELAAAMAETRQLREQLASETRTRLHLAGERDEARSDLTQLRALAAEILAAFEPSGSGHTARIGQVQHAKWAKRLGAFGEVRAETDSQP